MNKTALPWTDALQVGDYVGIRHDNKLIDIAHVSRITPTTIVLADSLGKVNWRFGFAKSNGVEINKWSPYVLCQVTQLDVDSFIVVKFNEAKQRAECEQTKQLANAKLRELIGLFPSYLVVSMSHDGTNWDLELRSLTDEQIRRIAKRLGDDI